MENYLAGREGDTRAKLLLRARVDAKFNSNQKMNYIKSILLAGAALAFFIPDSQAQSAFKTGNPLERITKKEHVDQLDAGSRLVLVCRGSDTATLIDIKDKKQAMELCREGRMIECRDCRRKFKVIWTYPPGKGSGPKAVMEIVNEKGEPCMFLARIK